MYNSNYKEWLYNVSEEEKKELLELHQEEIKERFSMPLDFGTAGMRGIIGLGSYRINNYTVARATKGLSDYINSLGNDACLSGVVIAYDTRLYSYEFALIAARVLAYNNIKVYMFEDVRPVPMCSFAIRYLGASAGIMITASHNPKEYNGYKVYGPDGAQMSPEATNRVVEYINRIEDYFAIDLADVNIKKREEIFEADNLNVSDNIKIIGKSIDKAFFDAISKQSMSKDAIKRQADKLKVVYTPIHGAGYKPVMQILERMNVPVYLVNSQAQPDAEFSTVSAPNPENEDALELAIEYAEAIGGNVVIGTDPDCDRMGIAIKDDNDKFYLLNGNQIGVLLLDYILKRKKELNILPENAAVVKTIVTTSLAKKIAESYGVEIFDVLTGFKFIGEKIKQWEDDGSHTFIFGYEESYGYLAGTHSRDKDAVVAALLFAEMVAYYLDKDISIHQRLNALFQKYGYYVEKSVATVYEGLDGMAKMSEIMTELRKEQITEIAGYKVEFYSDYNVSKTIYWDTKLIEEITLPKANVMYYGLSGGDWACVRPSGTEPKLKIYVSVSEKDKKSAQDKANKIISYMTRFL